MVMSQQGQLIRLKSTGRDGEPLWAYRYRAHVARESVQATPDALLQALSELMGAIQTVDHGLRYVARRPACPRVSASPKNVRTSYPRRISSRHDRQHKATICRFFVQGF
jgi:hypothetical protein